MTANELVRRVARAICYSRPGCDCPSADACDGYDPSLAKAAIREVLTALAERERRMAEAGVCMWSGYEDNIGDFAKEHGIAWDDPR